jgi:hypothetical protein
MASVEIRRADCLLGVDFSPQTAASYRAVSNAQDGGTTRQDHA